MNVATKRTRKEGDAEAPTFSDTPPEPWHPDDDAIQALERSSLAHRHAHEQRARGHVQRVHRGTHPRG